jgi:hypothetical protein
MLRAARSAPEESLSPGARERILDAALRRDVVDSPLPTLFSPARKLVVAGALPVLLGVALVVGIDPGERGSSPSTSTQSRIQVSKQGGQVRFEIVNGDRAHRVVRSTHPGRFEAENGVAVTDGSYAERLADSSDLVFYRID